MGRLHGKTAIITGGSGGIGAATARLFAHHGASVLLVDLDEVALRRTADQAESSRVSYFVADVSRPEQVQQYVEAAVDRYGRLDVLFANAGIEGVVQPIAQMNVEDFDRVIAVNLRGPWLAMHYAIPHIAKTGGGSIIVTSSVAGLVGFPGLAAYSSSKHGVHGLVKTAALECASLGIRVNSIHPGPIANRMMASLEQQISPESPAAAHEGLERSVPLGRYGTNEEVAELALFLAGEESRYCTGSAFVVDGGFLAR